MKFQKMWQDIKLECAVRFIKMHTSNLKYRIELCIGWRSFPLTGFWFGKRFDEDEE